MTHALTLRQTLVGTRRVDGGVLMPIQWSDAVVVGIIVAAADLYKRWGDRRSEVRVKLLDIGDHQLDRYSKELDQLKKDMKDLTIAHREDISSLEKQLHDSREMNLTLVAKIDQLTLINEQLTKDNEYLRNKNRELRREARSSMQSVQHVLEEVKEVQGVVEGITQKDSNEQQQ